VPLSTLQPVGACDGKVTNMGKTLIAINVSMMIILAGLLVAGVVKGQEDEISPVYSMVEVKQGTVGEGDYAEDTKDWNENEEGEAMGDYVAWRLAEDAWFYIAYGTEEEPNGIMIASMQLRYLGGATLHSEAQSMTIDQVGIPVASVYGQKLMGVFEFDDVGYPEMYRVDGNNMFFEGDWEIKPDGETVGANNSIWDFKRKSEGFDDFDDSFTNMEPAVKSLNLEVGWNLSEFRELENEKENVRSWDVRLTATDVPYNEVWDEEDDVEGEILEKVEFTFHVDIVAEDTKITGIPWYEVTVDDIDAESTGEYPQVKESRKVDDRDFEGTAINGQFKFDHYLKGWDYKEGAQRPMLSLEAVTVFGTWIPDLVGDWFDQEFISNDINNSLGFAQYEYENAETFMGSFLEGEERDGYLDPASPPPTEVQIIGKEGITFKDNWHKVGEFTWESEVEVDGEADIMHFQIHAGDSMEGRDEEDNGEFKALIIMGGYIYPGGEEIFHDPLISVSALLLDIESSIDAIPLGMVILQSFIGMMAVTTALYIRRKRKANRDY